MTCKIACLKGHSDFMDNNLVDGLYFLVAKDSARKTKYRKYVAKKGLVTPRCLNSIECA